jgi:hypothetical protein
VLELELRIDQRQAQPVDGQRAESGGKEQEQSIAADAPEP